MNHPALVPGRCSQSVIKIEQHPFLKTESLTRKRCNFQLRDDFTCPNKDSHIREAIPTAWDAR